MQIKDFCKLFLLQEVGSYGQCRLHVSQPKHCPHYPRAEHSPHQSAGYPFQVPVCWLRVCLSSVLFRSALPVKLSTVLVEVVWRFSKAVFWE